MHGYLKVLLFTLIGLELCASSVFAQRPALTGPQTYTSAHFQVFTDLSEEKSNELLERLETMLKLVSGYWGKPLRKPIRMFVVDNFENWGVDDLSKMDASGLASIRSGGGLTITRVQGYQNGPKIDADAIVYATSKHGTPQHEAVHAYCGITFGETGPVWYSEGMAEVGKYWKVGEKGVTTDPYVIQYLKSKEPKPLIEIVNNPLETTGDSWQNYAWRWTLCHLLGFNENYTQRFKPLGISLLAGNNSNFEKVYGAQAEEIEFEYKLFLKDMEPGYRCDLCSWDWKTRFKGISAKAQVVSNIAANKGWQASRLNVQQGIEYAINTDGEWKVSQDSDELLAAGDANGNGKLIGIIFTNYELSEPFELGSVDTFTPPASGKLYLRCKDNWGELSDNSGSIKASIKLAR